MAASRTIEFSAFKGCEGKKIIQGQVHSEVQPDQVVVEITHSGVCGSDLFFLEQDIVLGHEGVGIVKEIGEKVTQVKVGDRVGWGYQNSSCGQCKQCLEGFQTFCPERAFYGSANPDKGSMATYTVRSEEFLFKIPSAIESEHAGPLMCGGATVYNALVQGGVKASQRVGIVGIGGLGHLAIQYAAKMGCEVIVFSGTDSKRDESLQLGATEFYQIKGSGTVANLKIDPIDHLMVCTSHQPDWEAWTQLMAPRGTIYPIHVNFGQLVGFPYAPLIFSGLRVVGTLVASRPMQREMLEFTARHGIRPLVMAFPMTTEGITKAFETLQKGDMRYRGVLVATKAE